MCTESKPLNASLALQRVSIGAGAVILTVQAISTTSQCPVRGHPSTRVHGRYTRTLADLPWLDKAVRIESPVRRFACPLTDCPRKTFTERLPELAAACARSTVRHQDARPLVGQALRGEPDAQLATALGLPLGSDTFLHRVRQAPFR